MTIELPPPFYAIYQTLATLIRFVHFCTQCGACVWLGRKGGRRGSGPKLAPKICHANQESTSPLNLIVKYVEGGLKKGAYCVTCDGSGYPWGFFYVIFFSIFLLYLMTFDFWSSVLSSTQPSSLQIITKYYEKIYLKVLYIGKTRHLYSYSIWLPSSSLHTKLQSTYYYFVIFRRRPLFLFQRLRLL